MKMWKIFFFCYFSLAIQFCGSLCKWMLDHDESFPVFSSVVFVAAPIGRLSSIHDTGVYSKTLYSLHITHIIIITSVYCNFNIIL